MHRHYTAVELWHIRLRIVWVLKGYGNKSGRWAPRNRRSEILNDENPDLAATQSSGGWLCCLMLKRGSEGHLPHKIMNDFWTPKYQMPGMPSRRTIGIGALEEDAAWSMRGDSISPACISLVHMFCPGKLGLRFCSFSSVEGFWWFTGRKKKIQRIRIRMLKQLWMDHLLDRVILGLLPQHDRPATKIDDHVNRRMSNCHRICRIRTVTEQR